METTYPSPNGKYIFSVYPNEMRMSHTVEVPVLKLAETGRTLFTTNSLWDASNIKWTADSYEVSFFLRLYPGSQPGIKITLRPESNSATLVRGDEVIDESIQKAMALLEGWS